MPLARSRESPFVRLGMGSGRMLSAWKRESGHLRSPRSDERVKAVEVRMEGEEVKRRKRRRWRGR